MTIFRKAAVRAGLAVVALTSAVTVGQASTYFGAVNISVYQGPGNGNIADPNNQAQQGNPLIAAPFLLGSGTYTGGINLSSLLVNTIGAFLNSDGGTLSAGLNAIAGDTLSTGIFGITTVFDIKGFTPDILGGVITHDDGISLYDGPSFSNTVASAPFPVVASPTPFAGLTGNWELIYVEANGLPAVLDFEVTSIIRGTGQNLPLPAALPLFASGLGVLGFWARRRKSKGEAVKIAAC